MPVLPSADPASLHDVLLNLHARTEQSRRLVTQAVEQRGPDDLQRLVQELQQHQIELEMQNEELLLVQTELHQTRAEYVDLYDFAPVGYCTLSATGLIEQLNLCAARYLGQVRQCLQGRRLALFLSPADRNVFGQFIGRLADTEQGQTCEVTLLREDASSLRVRLEGLRMSAEGQPPRLRLALLDISSQQRAALALAASEERFRQLFERSRDAVALMQGTRYVDCNAAALHLLGASRREQVVGQVLDAFVAELQPDGRPTAALYAEAMARARQLGSWRCEAHMHRLTGEAIWMEAVITFVREEPDGALLHVLWRDVTEARAAAARLHQEKEFSESLLENSVDALIALAPDGRVTAWNAEAARYSGLPAARALGQCIFALLPHLDTPAGRALLARVLAGERVENPGQPFRQREGHYDAYLVPLHDQQQAVSGVLVIVRDVTERNRLAEEATQARLRQQQEVLAASLASQEAERKRIAEALHNGLGQLLYATKLSLEGADGERDSLADAQRLLLEAIRATRTISFELTPGVLEDFGLRIALEELVKRISPRQLPVGLHLRGLRARLPAPVEIAVYRIVQELLNNILRHAGATDVQVHLVRKARCLETTVEDNGRGFDTAALEARPLGGIGLAGVRNRVALLGGRLHVDSRPGRGTIVSFELPL